MPPALRSHRRPSITITESRGLRELYIGGEAIQSAMRLDDPYALALDYTRCMMSFLLFHPEPRRALMVGLGGDRSRSSCTGIFRAFRFACASATSA